MVLRGIFMILSISMIMISCSSSGGDDPLPPPQENSAPSAPALVFPINNMLCIDNVLQFDWEASTDLDSDVITYEVQVATDNQFTNIVHTSSTNDTDQEITLEKGEAHYWRVRAKDTKGGESEYSTIWQFYTEGDGEQNHLPFAPSQVFPVNASEINESSVELRWSANDVDNDVLGYNVFFGLGNPPNNITEGQTENTIIIDELESGQTYYWKIEVLDGNGGKTIGSLWSFRTL
ncbi:SusE outer membrane protein [Flagellimonas pacifica]|uniref:SusE outer membrane protein n=2 Tax=Flagellimonas pacifica TaxID=1247520 RepID=A0A285MQQ9_9FLAO|nr:SusE outer membrane protein [Allomuricauda parva]